MFFGAFNNLGGRFFADALQSGQMFRLYGSDLLGGAVTRFLQNFGGFGADAFYAFQFALGGRGGLFG